MSQETIEWLNTRILVGNVTKRGTAWHYKQSAQGVEPNHYDGPVPVEDVKRRLFNFNVIERDLSITLPDGTYQLVPGRKAMVTDDDNTVLGIFSGDAGTDKGYQGHDYTEWLVNGPANLVDQSQGELGIGTAGLLRNRGVAFVTVEVPENITTPEGVEFRPHLLAATSYDGTVATTYKRINGIVVCDNTLAAGLGEAGQVFKVKHTRYSGMKLTDAREALNIIYSAADDFAAEVKALCETKVNDRQWLKLLDETVPLTTVKGEAITGRALTMAENKRGELVKLWNHDERVAPWTGTAYGVLQAFNTYGAHLSIVRGRNGAEANRVERNIWGDIKDKNAQADAEVMTALAGVLAGD